MTKKVYYYALMPSDSTALWRIHGVLPYINSKDFLLIDISYNQHFNKDIMKGADVFIFQRPFTKQHADLILLCKTLGIKVILDYDDLLTAVDMYNPTYMLYKQHQETLFECLKMADELWVSTPAIKADYKHPNCHVIPNAHNDYTQPLIDKLAFNNNKKCMYRGGSSHRADVYEVGEQLVKVVNENPDWQFIFMGDRFEWIEQRTGENHEIVGGMPIPQYFSYVYKENPSAFIFPLCTTPFNEGKSNICWLEATYVGAALFGNIRLPEFNKPGVSDIKMLGEAIRGKHYGYMKEQNEKSWEWICDNVLLSKINQLRVDRILANL